MKKLPASIETERQRLIKVLESAKEEVESEIEALNSAIAARRERLQETIDKYNELVAEAENIAARFVVQTAFVVQSPSTLSLGLPARPYPDPVPIRPVSRIHARGKLAGKKSEKFSENFLAPSGIPDTMERDGARK